MWTWKERKYIPINAELRERIITWDHLDPMAGHPGVAKTLELITREYWWPQMKDDIEKYIKACHECQINKPDCQPKAAPLQPNEIPNEPWEIISVDLIGPMILSKGKDMILVFVDQFSKKAYFLPCNTTITSQGVANLYQEHIFKEQGKVISDRGPQFVSRFMKELYKNLGIEANPSTAYHPQTDRQTERVNQELEEYLQIYVSQKQNDWVDWLPIAQFCHNNRQHSATGYSPFMITGGQHPFKGREMGKPLTNQSVEEYIKQFKETWKTTKENLEKAAKKMKKQHNKKVIPSQQYKPGDQVYLDASKIKTTRASKKLDAKFYGPFKVLAAVGKSAYKLKLPSTWQIHDVLKLKQAPEPVFPTQKDMRPRPPPEIINGEEEHEVAEVIGVHGPHGKQQFLVKWKGLPQEENSWEPEKHMENAQDAIQDFFKKKNAQPLRALKTPLNRDNGSFIPSSLIVPPIVLTPPRTPASSLPLFCTHPHLHGWTKSEVHQEYLTKLDATRHHWKSVTEEL